MGSLPPKLDYIARLADCHAIEDVWALHVGKMAEYGFDRMIYGASRSHTEGQFGDFSDSMVLTNHDKDYIDLFFGKALYADAPMAIWALNNSGVCSWQWALDRRARDQTTEKENRILDLNTKMEVDAGYTLSYTHASERSRSGLGLCAKRGVTQSEVDALWEDKGAEIELFCTLMNMKIDTLPFKRQGKPLTARQREVLQWVADGKTLQDIAVIMDLNQPTIEKHLRLARENLNAGTTAQAVLKASLQNQFFLFEGVRTPKGKEIRSS